MWVRVLGAAAGGGFPQWNCNCTNCRRLRLGALHGQARTQAQVAVSADNHVWHLLNASPDLRQQIEVAPCLHPREGVRDSPIASVILTCAEVDQVLGLLLLREMQPFTAYATDSVRDILLGDNSIFQVLHRIPDQVYWRSLVPGNGCEIAAGLQVEPISLNGAFPGFVNAERVARLRPDEAVLGLVLKCGGHSMMYLPGVGAIDDALLEQMEQSDLVMLDGTFWSDDELIRVRQGARTARQMGHLPISGPEGSLQRLATLRRPRKVYIHINNTNPILDEDSPEYQAVREAGWEVACDGMTMEL